MKPLIMNYFDKSPNIHPEAFIAPGAAVIGEVTVGRLSSVWFNSVLRGDIEPVTVGEETNIQDGTVVHVTRNGYPTLIGSRVTVGHRCMLHACTIHDEGFVGMNATVLDRAVVETHGMVAAGAVVTPGKVVKSGELWAGVPAKRLRHLTDEEIEHMAVSAENYRKHAEEYLSLLSRGEY
jgi:carbonic anhydrase/acetyltransferase-like protein (isoleucine patch superfamily)